MRTINLELSKKLAPYLKEVDTEYIWVDIQWCIDIIKTNNWLDEFDYICKTFTLEEAIEFLPKTVKDWYIYWLQINWKSNLEYWIRYNNYAIRKFIYSQRWKTLLEAIEKMLEYLLDNNLLWKKN